MCLKKMVNCIIFINQLIKQMKKSSPANSIKNQTTVFLLFILIGYAIFGLGCKEEDPPPPATTTPTAGTQISIDSIADTGGFTYVTSPAGSGPFPGVLYSHGGMSGNIGGDLRATAVALAEAGYFARSELRQPTTGISGHLQEVEAALDELIADGRCDASKVGIIGFSRGGLLTLQAGASQATKVKAIISMAPAQANEELDNTLTDVSAFDDPILILVAENDLIQDDHVQLAQMAYDSLFNNGKNVTHILYPYYDSNGDGLQNTPPDDGHELFWEVQEPYWTDLIDFLNANL